MTAALLELDAVSRHYRLPRRRLFERAPRLRAVDGVSLVLPAGRSLGIVGESGSGKSTLARLAMALERPNAGQVRFDGQDLNALSGAALRRARRDFQMVFQDPYGSLDPRQTVARIVAEPLQALGAAEPGDRLERIAAALAEVGLGRDALQRYPHEFSGGQRQRIAIARALVTRPRLIVADEPVSALDVSVQAQVLNLLQDLRRDHGLSYLLISHDLAVVDLVCDEVAVIYRGRVVEQGPPERLFRAAAHPYTRALLEAVPSETPGRRRVRSALPPLDAALPALRGSLPRGCAYRARCPWAAGVCVDHAPELTRLDGEAEHRAACHLAAQVRSEPGPVRRAPAPQSVPLPKTGEAVGMPPLGQDRSPAPRRS